MVEFVASWSAILIVGLVLTMILSHKNNNRTVWSTSRQHDE